MPARVFAPATHSVPPRKGVLAGPFVPKNRSPFWFGRAPLIVTAKFCVLRLGTPLEPICATPPWEFTFPWQYVVAVQLGPPFALRNTETFAAPSFATTRSRLPLPSSRPAVM